jgi:pyruvate,water dikinase
MKDQIVVLGETQDATIEQLGGKAARLDQMIGDGLPVPPAFCLTTGLFEHFLTESGLRDRLADIEPHLIRTEILTQEIPGSIAQGILAAYAKLGRPRLAVRSSASQEDSQSHSFAGQHDTVLDVYGDDELLDAVRVCWASLWSDRATVYRDDPTDVGSIAVAVQEMVNSDVAGVAFTADPVHGTPGRLVIEACWGLGEGLVSGRVTSDYFQVDENTKEVVESRINYKVTQCAAVSPGTVDLVKVAPERRDVPCLTPEQLTELSELCWKVRTLYGGEQDIEWVLKDGTFYVIQSRPITTTVTRAHDGTTSLTPYLKEQPQDVVQGTLWSRMDIGEIFVGGSTPLGLSFHHYYLRQVHASCLREFGVRDVGDMDLHMGHFHGHVYLNLSYTSYVLSQHPPTRDQAAVTARYTSEEVDLTAYRNPFGQYPGDVRGDLATWMRVNVAEERNARQRADTMTESRLHEYDRAQGIDLTALGRRELSAELDHRLKFFHDMHVGYLPDYINAFGFYEELTRLCAEWLGDQGSNLQNRLKTDMSNLRTVETAREMWQLTQAARQWPGVIKLIESTPLGELGEVLRADTEGKAFWDQHMAPFLRENGVRARQEMELVNPRWIDDPSYIFQMIRRYHEEGVSVDEHLGRADNTESNVQAILAGLPPHKREILERVIQGYTLCSELREITRMAMIVSVWLVRNVVYEVARRLTKEGVLHSQDEVAYLDFHDILSFLSSQAEARDHFPRARIEERRRAHEYYKRLPEPPLSFVGEYDVTRAVTPVAGDAALTGLGASPGRIVGRARIVENLAWEADEFRPGEILVARFTDASWTPLFGIAGGVVTDIGSMLSHSSIVSREFGIPSVVNTKRATTRISTGDLVMVDGDAGTVTVLEE